MIMANDDVDDGSGRVWSTALPTMPAAWVDGSTRQSRVKFGNKIAAMHQSGENESMSIEFSLDPFADGAFPASCSDQSIHCGRKSRQQHFVYEYT